MRKLFTGRMLACSAWSDDSAPVSSTVYVLLACNATSHSLQNVVMVDIKLMHAYMNLLSQPSTSNAMRVCNTGSVRAL